LTVFEATWGIVMNRQVALIRGINVGKAKRVAMGDLRAMVEGLGYTDVRTLLNSGNVVYTVPPRSKGNPAARIQEGIASKLGVSARVMVVTAEAVAAVVADNPFHGVADDHSRYMVSFLSDPADLARLTPLTKQDWAPDALALGKQVVYQWCASGILESNVAKAVGKALGDAATARNWATVLKLHELLKA
jgi:uncharacterized protein (DUF1697 family)